MDEARIAIHEAGHAVAHIRLGQAFASVTIEPDAAKGQWGSLTGEGRDHVYTREDAEAQVLCSLGGHAALIAAGYDHESSVQGTDGDIDDAELILADWLPGDNIEGWLQRTVAMMQEPANTKAVSRITKELLLRRTVPFDAVDCLVEVADGNLSEGDYQARVVPHYWPSDCDTM